MLELGPYVGGSTIALAMGLKQTATRLMVSVDGGGTSDNDHLPSSDIHADWRRNVERFGVGDIPTLVPGVFVREQTQRAVETIAAGRRFDVLLLDGDGQVDLYLRQYGHLLTDDCLLILDDYFNVTGDQSKRDATAMQINRMMLAGRAEQYVLAPWSTWFGRLNRRKWWKRG